MSVAQKFGELRLELKRNLIDMSDLTDRLLIGLLTGKHILVEGAPGLAKTRSVKELAQLVGGDFERVQCTPDLLPSDITGSLIYQQKEGQFDFSPGPIFTNLLLVDEINRSPPKVQSALLEAMEERQVTVGRNTHKLPEPFLVVATQNPIEYEGTFPLPEAQLDRFLLKYTVPMPSAETELKILDLVEGEAIAQTLLKPMFSKKVILSAQKEVASVHVSAALKDYVIRIAAATRSADYADVIEHAVSPRGSIALTAACRAHAFLNERDYVAPEDVAKLALDTLAHRVGLTWRALADGKTSRSVMQDIFEATEVI